MTTAAQNASPGVYVSDDVGLDVTDGTYSRVQLGLITGTNGYGLKVVSSDGTTVIIDGTSDMFKISATGTTSVTVANNASNSSSVTLTGLGALSTTPGSQAYVNNSNSSAQQRNLGVWLEGIPGAVFVALASGGSPTQTCIAARSYAAVDTSLNGSSQCVLRLFADNGSGGSETYFTTYYVLQEAAL